MPSSIRILEYAENNSHVIASSKKVVNQKPNPPHYAARTEYVKKVGESGFRNTAVNKSESEPKPLIYTIDSNGHTLEKVMAAAATTITHTSYRAG